MHRVSKELRVLLAPVPRAHKADREYKDQLEQLKHRVYRELKVQEVLLMLRAYKERKDYKAGKEFRD